MTRPSLGISLGDPAGVGPECILKLFAGPDKIDIPYNAVAFGRKEALESAARTAGADLPAIKHLDPQGPWDLAPGELGLIETGGPLGDIRPGIVSPEYGKASYDWVCSAISAAKQGHLDAVVTAPICKESWAAAGIGHIGHTELFSESFDARGVMMLAGSRLRVVPLTIHVPLKIACAMLSMGAVIGQLRIVQKSLIEDFGIERPRMALSGLNPHAGEHGCLGDEEQLVLSPAAEFLRREGMDLTGPEPADSLFAGAADGGFDVVACPTHDQALIPFKMLHFRDGVNLTVGLPIVRTSPVHGTAFDIAGKGTADPGSMKSAVLLAAELATRRKSS